MLRRFAPIAAIAMLAVLGAGAQTAGATDTGGFLSSFYVLPGGNDQAGDSGTDSSLTVTLDAAIGPDSVFTEGVFTPGHLAQSGDPEFAASLLLSIGPSSISESSSASLSFSVDQQYQITSTAALTGTTSVRLDWALGGTAEVPISATQDTYAISTLDFFRAEEGQSGVPIGSANGLIYADQQTAKDGSLADDLILTDQGGGLWDLDGAGSITFTTTLGSQPRVGIGWQPALVVGQGSNSYTATLDFGDTLSFGLVPLEPNVTITTIPAPEPVAAGCVAAVVALAGLARRRSRATS